MPTHRCPTCGKAFRYAAVEAHPTYPFCSERCRTAELGAWLDGRYVVSRPASEAEAEALPAEEPGRGGDNRPRPPHRPRP